MTFRNILPSLLMLFAISAHAESATTSMKDTSKCGLLDNSNLIDGYAMTVCPQNVYMQIKQSFLGDKKEPTHIQRRTFEELNQLKFILFDIRL